MYFCVAYIVTYQSSVGTRASLQGGKVASCTSLLIQHDMTPPEIDTHGHTVSEFAFNNHNGFSVFHSL